MCFGGGGECECTSGGALQLAPRSTKGQQELAGRCNHTFPPSQPIRTCKPHYIHVYCDDWASKRNLARCTIWQKKKQEEKEKLCWLTMHATCPSSFVGAPMPVLLPAVRLADTFGRIGLAPCAQSGCTPSSCTTASRGDREAAAPILVSLTEQDSSAPESKECEYLFRVAFSFAPHTFEKVQRCSARADEPSPLYFCTAEVRAHGSNYYIINVYYCAQ